MTGQLDPLAGLRGLRDRLAAGIGAVAPCTLTGEWRAEVTSLHAVGRARLAAPLADLYQVRVGGGRDSAAMDGDIGLIAERFAGHRAAMLTVLFSPVGVLADVPAVAGQDGADWADRWFGLCWLAEAAWRVTDLKMTGPGYAAGDHELLRPLAARLRFLLLAEPMRYRAREGNCWLPAATPAYGEYGLAGRVFGTSGWNLLVGRCREARQVWRDCLDGYQSHPYLAAASAAELEQDVRALGFAAPGAPLTVSVRPLDEAVPLTAEDAAVISEVTERHLLPRFDLRAVAALARYAPDPAGRRWRLAWALGVAGAGLAAVGCAIFLQVTAAAAVAVGCYVLIGGGAIKFGPSWSAMWLLRLPAASAVGLFALVSLLPGSWLNTPYAGWAAGAVLAFAAYGYLAVEVRNHGVAARPALLRAAGVTGIGAVHGLMVSLIGLVAVAPAFVSQGSDIAALWRSPGYGHAGMLLLLAAMWCLAVGVFSQILWEDRPVTAPLAHLQWRSGR